MKMRARRLLVSTCLALLLLPSWPVAVQTSAAVTQDESWISFAPPGEEIAALVPGPPLLRTYPPGKMPKLEPILARQEYNGYGSGVIFVIQSFKAEHPEKVPVNVFSAVNDQAIFERLNFDGITAELFRTTVQNRYSPYTKRTLRFLTAHHLYVIHLMALEENNPAVDKFLSSVRLRKPDDQVTRIEPAPAEAKTGGEAFMASEVTRRAIIVWKNEPSYTDEARAHSVIGRIRLTAVLADNGYVSEINVIEGLRDGLSERAIEATRNIRFFPALKDGKPVSQRIQLEYNFNLY